MDLGPLMPRPMFTDPARLFSGRFDLLNGERLAMQSIDRRLFIDSLGWITETPDDIDVAADQCCRMEVGRWKDVFRIAQDIEPAATVMDDYIVVDAEVRI